MLNLYDIFKRGTKRRHIYYLSRGIQCKLKYIQFTRRITDKMERLHRSRINTNNKPNQHQVLRREGLAVAVPTWTSRTSKRRSSVSSFSLSEANLLLVVASERNFIQNVITISRKSSPRKTKSKKTKISEEQTKRNYQIGGGIRRGDER